MKAFRKPNFLCLLPLLVVVLFVIGTIKPAAPVSAVSSCPVGVLSGSSTPAPTVTSSSTSSPLSRVDKLTCVQYATSTITPSGQKLIKRRATNKNTVAFAPQLASQRGSVSTTLRGNAYVRVPSGSVLFPQNPDLASGVDALATAIQAAGQSTQTSKQLGTSTEISYFVPLFRKLQFMVLNDLYIYLTALYSTFNMTHADDEPSYLSQEPQQALNKKSLIVSHLLNVIQGQMYYICSTQQPLMPKQLGLKGGALLIQQDATVDPTFLLKDFSQPFFPGDLTTAEQKSAHATFATVQATYLSTLKQTINFFTEYTSYLTKPDPASSLPGSNAFASIAEHIATVIATDSYHVGVAKIQAMPGTQTTVSQAEPGSKLVNATGISSANVSQQATAQKITALRTLRQQIKPINPPFFYYDSDTLRALKVIPRVASELPPATTSIGWPSQLIASAQQGTLARTRGGSQTGQGQSLGFPVAYFLTAQQEPTTDLAQAAQLFINLPTSNGPYAQEIKKQPDWLNSSAGILSVLRACLGDYSQLIGLSIINSCTEQILCKALGKPCSAQPSQATCQQELALVNQVQQEYMQNFKAAQSGSTTTPGTSTSTGTTGSSSESTSQTALSDPTSALAGAGYLSGGLSSEGTVGA